MLRLGAVILIALSSACCAQSDKKPALPQFDYDVARQHEIKPHRRNIPVEGVQGGMNQLSLKLTISTSGDVIHAETNGDDQTIKYWPQLQGEVGQWRFTPFEQNGHPVVAEIEEYIDLGPPERLPTKHVAPPPLRADSKILITLERSGCFGSCPAYAVTAANDGIVFEGNNFVVASGKHVAPIDPDALRKLAKEFVAADIYSMAPGYMASVTDCPTYALSISIDGQTARVVDYMGSWVGMPAVISDLEDEVDTFAATNRWIEGSDGLVPLLQAEKFNFETFGAQMMLKEAAARGHSGTVRELLQAGVPLKPIPAPKRQEGDAGFPIRDVGWLAAASNHLDSLRVMIQAAASKNDQGDKDLALGYAARSGDIEAVRALIAYGANPSANFAKRKATEDGGETTMQGPGEGSVLIYAALSGNPQMVSEILRFHPNLEARAHDGKTAMFAAAEYEGNAEDADRVECVRLLAKAGANINARDHDGNTPLHETFLTPVEEELLKLGANVNARNKDGETPIFTTVDKDAIAIYAAHGADFTIRNNQGQTVLEAAESRGQEMKDAILAAMQQQKNQ